MWAGKVAYAAVLFVLAVSAPAGMAQAQQGAVTSVVEAQRRLRRLSVADSMETDVPIAIQGAIGDFKRALATETDSVVTRLPAGVTAAEGERQLRATMPASTVGKVSDEQSPAMGKDSKAPTVGLYGGSCG